MDLDVDTYTKAGLISWINKICSIFSQENKENDPSYHFKSTYPSITADVVKLVDTLDLGSSAFRRVGSTPIIRTKFGLTS